jgi:hypothetical protein
MLVQLRRYSAAIDPEFAQGRRCEDANRMACMRRKEVMIKRLAVFPVIIAALAVGTALVSPAAGASGQSDVAALRQATAKFHDLDATRATGRVDLHLCMDHMGQHFADPQTFSDGILDPTNPEAMVYADDGMGHLRLVAVEWVSTTPGTVMNIPLHFSSDVGLWILHAWIWSPNPDGMFADMNPRIGNCPQM